MGALRSKHSKADTTMPTCRHTYREKLDLPYFSDHMAYRIISHSIKNWMVCFFHMMHQITRRIKW